MLNNLQQQIVSRPRSIVAAVVLFIVLCDVTFMTGKFQAPAQMQFQLQRRSLVNPPLYVQQKHDIVVRAAKQENPNVLSKAYLIEAMKMHKQIETMHVTVDGTDYTFLDLCAPVKDPSATCVSSSSRICNCQLSSVLKQWNYDLETLENDPNYFATLNQYNENENDNLEDILDKPMSGTDGSILMAKGFKISYFFQIRNRSTVESSRADEAFSNKIGSVSSEFPSLHVDVYPPHDIDVLTDEPISAV